MTSSASLCAAAHNGSKEFIGPCDHGNTTVLAGWIPSKRASIQHSFHFSFFHFAPNSSRARYYPTAPKNKAMPRTSERAVSAITKMSITLCRLFNASI